MELGREENGALFMDYIKKFLKIKAESSGIPNTYAHDPEEFVNLFCEHEGIALNIGNLVYNASRRNTAKICLNSLW